MTGHEGLILCTASYSPTNRFQSTDPILYLFPWRGNTDSEQALVYCASTAHGVHGTIIPGTEGSGSRSVGHTRRSRLEIWRQLSRRADPASSATVSPTCSSTTPVLAMELCTVLLLTSFRQKRIRKVGWDQGKEGNTHIFKLQDFPWSPDTFKNRVRYVG